MAINLHKDPEEKNRRTQAMIGESYNLLASASFKSFRTLFPPCPSLWPRKTFSWTCPVFGHPNNRPESKFTPLCLITTNFVFHAEQVIGGSAKTLIEVRFLFGGWMEIYPYMVRILLYYRQQRSTMERRIFDDL